MHCRRCARALGAPDPVRGWHYCGACRLWTPGRQIPARPSFTCPVCDRTTYHPRDVDERYCSACHAWTGQPFVCAGINCLCHEFLSCASDPTCPCHSVIRPAVVADA